MPNAQSLATPPEKTVFIMNVMHCHESKQDETLAAIDAVILPGADQ